MMRDPSKTGPTLDRRSLLGLAAAAIAGGSFNARAQAGYPSRTLTIIVPFAAGGATDTLGRLMAQQLSSQLGVSVIIENKPGAGGSIAAGALKQAGPDGHTLFLGTVSTHGINPTLYKALPYDAVKDFAPISRIAGVPNVLVVSPRRVKATTVAELVAEGKARKEGLTFASSGNGTSVHLSGELFRSKSGITMTHVPYRGSGPAMADLVGGAVDLMFDNLPSALPLIQSGTLRALGVTSDERAPQLPAVPTLREVGFPGMGGESWFALFALAGTPPAIIERLAGEINDALARPALNERFAALGMTPRPLAGPALQAFITEEIRLWGEVVRASGASVQ
ncbi:tripartite tricarboxylate transporter substrate binding protein [Rhabdaerophilum sp. SD176]|uniref:Bug family tripartite tricarboxylate transporter substrate binding protein n=1 Tax=Rhabdaerophilum sp. SD176 TaxID=2983548 RepID=UPI0024DFD61A|nr:tripartite tricarboxylate transporter substrate binding protein [Rhabdaerophilum sp. SD176]